jgi:hypothetical protein
MRPQTMKLIGTAIAVLVSCLILLMAGQGLLQLQESSRQAGLQVARTAIDHAIMQCYALEGAYPPSLAYLQANYGLVIDEEHYLFLFQSVAANIPPLVEVQFR